MAVTSRTIQHLRNEVYAGGGPTDLGHYGSIWFGRANCSLGEFLGRSWYKEVSGAATDGAGWSNNAVPDRGNFQVHWSLSSSGTPPGAEGGDDGDGGGDGGDG